MPEPFPPSDLERELPMAQPPVPQQMYIQTGNTYKGFALGCLAAALLLLGCLGSCAYLAVKAADKNTFTVNDDAKPNLTLLRPGSADRKIAVIADQRKFVSALIVPNFALLEEYARDNGIKVDSPEALCRNPKVQAMMTERMETLQQGLASYERIKRFTLLPKPFSMENGELTNTLKIRRNVLLKNYASEIEAMYQE